MRSHLVADVLKSPRTRRVGELALGPALLIAVWWVAYAGELVNKDLLPSPFATISDTARAIFAGEIIHDFT